MRYVVVWIDEAFDQMGSIIRNNPGRKVTLAHALGMLSERLSRNPHDAGESREEEDTRVVIVDPLTVYFRIDEEDQVVEIGRVLLTG